MLVEDKGYTKYILFVLDIHQQVNYIYLFGRQLIRGKR